MYENVFPWLQKRQIPFLFTSSYVVDQVYFLMCSSHSCSSSIHQDLPYGAVKWLGEKWVDQLSLGRTVRLWNVYGPERLGRKSHVVADWVAACVAAGAVTARTDGTEERQVRPACYTPAVMPASVLTRRGADAACVGRRARAAHRHAHARPSARRHRRAAAVMPAQGLV
jgi:nucleoside-diphosphate-sugar epimerase